MPKFLKQSHPVSIECVAKFLRMHRLTQGNILEVFSVFRIKTIISLLVNNSRCSEEHYAWIVNGFKL